MYANHRRDFKNSSVFQPVEFPFGIVFRMGLGSNFGHLDSGSTLHFPVKKFPEKTESSNFTDTWVINRSARNDAYRDDSL